MNSKLDYIYESKSIELAVNNIKASLFEVIARSEGLVNSLEEKYNDESKDSRRNNLKLLIDNQNERRDHTFNIASELFKEIEHIDRLTHDMYDLNDELLENYVEDLKDKTVIKTDNTKIKTSNEEEVSDTSSIDSLLEAVKNKQSNNKKEEVEEEETPEDNPINFEPEANDKDEFVEENTNDDENSSKSSDDATSKVDDKDNFFEDTHLYEDKGEVEEKKTTKVTPKVKFITDEEEEDTPKDEAIKEVKPVIPQIVEEKKEEEPVEEANEVEDKANEEVKINTTDEEEEQGEEETDSSNEEKSTVINDSSDDDEESDNSDEEETEETNDFNEDENVEIDSSSEEESTEIDNTDEDETNDEGNENKEDYYDGPKPVYTFTRNDEETPKAILVSNKQYKKLLKSLKTQESLFYVRVVRKSRNDLYENYSNDTKTADAKVNNDLFDENILKNGSIREKQDYIEQMMDKANSLYKEGRTEDAQIMYDKISEVNKEIQMQRFSRNGTDNN